MADMGLVETDAINLVKELRRDRTQRFQISIEQLHEDEIVRVGNGIDLKYKRIVLGDEKGGQYERKCFNRIINNNDHKLFLGPNMTDYLLNQNQTARFRKPDSLEFDKRENEWQLAGLYEFKSSTRNHNVHQKLSGIQQMISLFRENPEYLKVLMESSMDKIIKVPERIIVPDDKSIDFTFVYPNKVNLLTSVGLPFYVKYLQVK